jgi:hypothetical protein
MAGKVEWQRHGSLLLSNNIGGIIEEWMASTVDDRDFIKAMFKLASNQTPAHSKDKFLRTLFSSVSWGMAQLILGYGTVGYISH